jgi:hypothetical protein
MKKEQNLENSTEQALTIPVVSKRKYWYKTDIYSCVLCGKEKVYKERVYNKKDKGTYWHDDVCWGHF